MQERAVEQGLSRREEKEIECLGIDEKSFLKGHLPNILTYLRHRITNAMAEGINSKIQQVKSAARGFRNFYNYRIAILFHCGKLNMYPHKSLQNEFFKELKCYSLSMYFCSSGVQISSLDSLLFLHQCEDNRKYAHTDLERLKVDMKNLALKGKAVTRLSPAKIIFIISILLSNTYGGGGGN